MLERVAVLVAFHVVPNSATLVMPVTIAALIAIDFVAPFEVELVFAPLIIVSELPSPFEVELVSDVPLVSDIEIGRASCRERVLMSV